MRILLLMDGHFSRTGAQYKPYMKKIKSIAFLSRLGPI